MRNALALLTVLTSGCLWVADVDPGPGPGPGPVVNSLPFIVSGDAYVSWDPYYYDDIWSFEATVDDGDGPLDVVEVYVDIYDDYTGTLVESLDLLPSEDPYFWYSDWYGSSLYLDPWGSYTVDIIAIDSFDEFDVYSVSALTYY